jgi:hypothetical protein
MKQFQSLKQINNPGFNATHYQYTNQTVKVKKKSKAHIGFCVLTNKAINGKIIKLVCSAKFVGHVNINMYRKARGGGYRFMSSIAYLEGNVCDRTFDVNLPESEHEFQIAIIINANQTDITNNFLKVEKFGVVNKYVDKDAIADDYFVASKYLTNYKENLVNESVSKSTATLLDLTIANHTITIKSCSSTTLYCSNISSGKSGNIVLMIKDTESVDIKFSNQWITPECESFVIRSGELMYIQYYSPTSKDIGPVIVTSYIKKKRNYKESVFCDNGDTGTTKVSLKSNTSYGMKIKESNSIIGKVLSRVDLSLSYIEPGPDSLSADICVVDKDNNDKGTVGWINQRHLRDQTWVTFNNGEHVVIKEDDAIILKVKEYDIGGGDHAFWLHSNQPTKNWSLISSQQSDEQPQMQMKLWGYAL